ncbi:MAG: crossover junction endodeoxyribonuclease RuvC [Clostridia bacterium]|nr:crossover junction endodeoxyribonuclease RuvC [Clostridia bacterium]
MLILGIDPGYAIIGWGVIRYERGRYIPVDFGAVTTAAGLPFNRRLEQIYDELTALLARYTPDAVAVEKLYFQNNQKTAIDVAQARGVTMLAIQKSGTPVYEYTPLQVKSAVTGFGQAQKPQVMEMTKRLLRLKAVPKPDDTADALAIAICHAQYGGTPLKQALLKER